MRVIQLSLNHDFGIADVRHVYAGDVLGCALVGQVKDAAAVPGLVQMHPFADVAEAV